VCIGEKSHVEAAIRAPPRPPRRLRKAAEEIDSTDAVLLSELVEVMASTVTDNRYSHEQATTYGRFLDRIEAIAPTHMDVHLVVDNYDTHKAQKIREWMSKRPRFQAHLAPEHDAWLDQVDRWFEMPVPRRPDPYEHQSAASFRATSVDFLAEPDEPSKPFVWTKSAQEIAATIARFAL
jgi:hypothetical protein